MDKIRYISGVSTLKYDETLCIGCKACTLVCPHSVFEFISEKADLKDPDACMECGACVKNCPSEAISVSPGVGCAAYIIQKWIKGEENASCGCGDSCC